MRNSSAFLKAAGFAAARLAPLPSDASHRRYARLRGGPRPALLMDAPPPEDVRPFLAVQRHIAAIGLSAPEILAADEAAGFLLIEDLGDATHATLLDAGADPLPLYLEAAETLAALHAAPPPAHLPAWGPAEMARATAATFLDWWWPAAFGGAADAEARAHLDAALIEMLAPFADAGCFVHRDYFPANLLRLEARPTPRRTGLIDFQDAATGSPAYDLVSLVEDARRDVAPAVRNAAIARYLAARPGLDRDALAAAMAACAAQRHLRVAALWVRLARRDAKPGYLAHGPRCWRLLDRALRHPATEPLRDFLDDHVPPALRRTPTVLTEPA
jgi:aminoglycoside/choline kinase family phosphotransferase